ncbi:hypothetical protein ACIBQ0_19985 [Nocardia nova]|uniref:hypothetical protein n=1 Tax=Nocardia TaxID=1817 RepID=UPI0012DC3801|nr:hypothetical protein [Nocardia sp. NRRL WC-3656]
MTREHSAPQHRRETWFGPLSFRGAAVCLTLNVIPFFINGYLIFALVLLYAIELIAAAVLCARGGRARQLCTGIAVALVGTAGCFVLLPALGRLS